MSLPDGLFDRVPLVLVRGLAVLGFVAVFVAASSLFRPHDSSAEDLPRNGAGLGARVGGLGRSGARIERLTPTTKWAYAGALVGVNYTLEVYLTPSGARYTVRNADGAVLAERLTDDDLYREFPDLDINTMRADAPTSDEGRE